MSTAASGTPLAPRPHPHSLGTPLRRVPTGPTSLTFSTFFGPFTSSCLLGIVPPSQPIANQESRVSSYTPQRPLPGGPWRPPQSLPARWDDATRRPRRGGAAPWPSPSCQGERRSALGEAGLFGLPGLERVLAGSGAGGASPSPRPARSSPLPAGAGFLLRPGDRSPRCGGQGGLGSKSSPLPYTSFHPSVSDCGSGASWGGSAATEGSAFC